MSIIIIESKYFCLHLLQIDINKGSESRASSLFVKYHHQSSYFVKRNMLLGAKRCRQQTHVPDCSLTAIPKAQGMEFKVQRRAVHLNKQIMALALESSPPENLDGNNMALISASV